MSRRRVVITGMGAGGHGIYDFIHRDPESYLPLFSATEVIEPEKTLKIGKWIIPMSKGQTLLLRKGVAWWQLLDEHEAAVVQEQWTELRERLQQTFQGQIF